MICNHCHTNQANMRILHEINGVSHEIFLCEQCVKNNPTFQVVLPSGTQNVQLKINGILQGFVGGHWPNALQKKVLECALCGMDFQEFQKSGKIGCGNCYEIFVNELSPVIARIHGSVEYKGKTPGNIPLRKEDDELETLKRDLKKAIECENYERAAEIRDSIRDLESSNNQE